MTLLKNTRIQHLVLKHRDQKPTIPASGAKPGDTTWKSTDILIGEWAYNKIDEIWYYNNGTEIKAMNPPAETLTTENVSLYDPARPNDSGGYAYYAGNTYVSYSNPDSSDSEYHTESIYRCVEDALQGESPETHPAKWENQGSEVEVSGGALANIFIKDTAAIRAITNYKDGNNVVDKSTGVIYRYKKDATSGLQPNDNSEDTGRWVENGKIIFEAPEDGKPYIRKDATWEEMPSTGLPSTWEANATDIRALTDHEASMDVGNYATGAVYEYDDTSTATDDGDTILKPDDVATADPGRWVKQKTFALSNTFKETLIFRDLEIYEFTKSQSYKITEVIEESGVTASIKLHDTSTDYTIGDTINAFDRLDITVDVLGTITIKGELV